MRARAKQLLTQTQLLGLAQATQRRARRLRRQISGLDRALLARYLATHPVRRLHLGCGDHLLDGWLNTDDAPSSPDVMHLDATAAFPLPDDSMDAVFSEHMIEHLPYSQGVSMLGESHRVLREGGKIRVSTPDLDFLLALTRPDLAALQREYIEWATARFTPDAPAADGVFVLNNFVRDWGHRFIYDEPTLRAALVRAGFTEVVLRPLQESDDPALRGLENEARMPMGFLRLETMTLEGVKRRSP